MESKGYDVVVASSFSFIFIIFVIFFSQPLSLMIACLLLLVLPAFVFAGSICSVNSPSECDALSKELAFSFFCSNAQSDECILRMNNQFRALAPADYPTLDASLAASRPVFQGHQDIYGPSRFLSIMQRARMPGSVEQAQAFNESIWKVLVNLDKQCGDTWRLQNCNAKDGCPPRNYTCEDEVDIVTSLLQGSRMSVFFAARRQHQHLLNMNMSCMIQVCLQCLCFFVNLGQNSSECVSFVSARIGESAAWISANAPKLSKGERAILLPIGVAGQLLERQCGVDDLPCVKELLDPILKASDLSSTNQALQGSFECSW